MEGRRPVAGTAIDRKPVRQGTTRPSTGKDPLFAEDPADRGRRERQLIDENVPGSPQERSARAPTHDEHEHDHDHGHDKRLHPLTMYHDRRD